MLVAVARYDLFLPSFLTDTYLFFWQKCQNEITELKEKHIKQQFLHIGDHRRLVYLENELGELRNRHQAAMESFKEAVSQPRYSYTTGVRKANIDPVEQIRTYKLAKAHRVSLA